MKASMVFCVGVKSARGKSVGVNSVGVKCCLTLMPPFAGLMHNISTDSAIYSASEEPQHKQFSEQIMVGCATK